MVVIRLSRGGSNKRPFYHLVVTDQRNRRDGRYIERLGYFNPIARGQDSRMFIELERVDHWIGLGAQPSDRVTSLLKEFRKDPAKAAAAVVHVAKPKKAKAALATEEQGAA